VNCEQARELAALAASGDVTVPERKALDAHAAGCAACCAEVEAFGVLCAQLAAMREESAPDGVYAAVRARVSAEVGQPRGMGWWTAWAGFAAAVACSLILLVELRPEANRIMVSAGGPAVVEKSAVSSIDHREAPASTSPSQRRRIRRQSVRGAPLAPEEPLVMRIFTDDPDVVIYWIADGSISESKKDTLQ